jgi:hypothetical protein
MTSNEILTQTPNQTPKNDKKNDFLALKYFGIWDLGFTW